ncbi:MAG: septal ring lytic transglycosylase RlpA family protein [Gammaproteobacteria bacterium]|nr:septal ring lytic transglycosylase RlpA family protein [Gammaproteobacteria bacterium]
MHTRHTIGAAIVCLLLSACSGMGHKDSAPARTNIDINRISNAVPKVEPFSRYGNPDKYEVRGKTYYTLKSNAGFKQRGVASWYGTKFHGRRTSSGEPYDMYAMTAAHKTLPLPSYVKVRNLSNNREIIVKVNDRGPFHEGRIIDLSYVAAIKLGIDKTGTAPVSIETVSANNGLVNGERGVFVQVGAYQDQENAKSVKTMLSELDIASEINPVTINARKRIYRVRIGPFKEKQKANEVVANLQKIGMDEARVFTNKEF